MHTKKLKIFIRLQEESCHNNLAKIIVKINYLEEPTLDQKGYESKRKWHKISFLVNNSIVNQRIKTK